MLCDRAGRLTRALPQWSGGRFATPRTHGRVDFGRKLVRGEQAGEQVGCGDGFWIVSVETREKRYHLFPDLVAWSVGLDGLVDVLGRCRDGVPVRRLLGDRSD
jgi:hypothetical protein